jgi:hypothetical protein
VSVKVEDVAVNMDERFPLINRGRPVSIDVVNILFSPPP